MTEDCDHPEKDHWVKWVKTEADSRPVPRWFCKRCNKIGDVIYKVNLDTGNPIVNAW